VLVLGTAINKSSRLSKEFDWLIRLSDSDIERPFMDTARVLLDSGSTLGREAAHTILEALGTREAEGAIDDYPLPESESQHRFRVEREANPCHPWSAWSDEACAKCMDRKIFMLSTFLSVWDHGFSIRLLQFRQN